MFLMGKRERKIKNGILAIVIICAFLLAIVFLTTVTDQQKTEKP